ncbi:MAG: excinuclease ABC subunit UvrA [bacterium]
MPKNKNIKNKIIHSIDIYGAKVHNLKNIDISIPREKLVIITGLSGSGKSSLAFDTIYAEGQRRYAESLSTYVRQFLGLLDKPDVDKITGLSPTIAIDQKGSAQNPRSTVGTATEIYDYLRILFTNLGKPYCYECGNLMEKHDLNTILKDIKKFIQSGALGVLFKIESNQESDAISLLNNIASSGYKEVLIDDKTYTIASAKEIIKKASSALPACAGRLAQAGGRSFLKGGNLMIYVYGDILTLDKKSNTAQGLKFDYDKKTIISFIKKILDMGNGQIILFNEETKEKKLYSENYYCAECGRTLPKIEPRCFSFNSPYGACPKCKGIGTRLEIDIDAVFLNKNLTLAEGAIDPFNKVFPNQTTIWKRLEYLSKTYKFSFDTPIKEMKKEHIDLILYGNEHSELLKENTGVFEGLANILLKKYEEAKTEYIKKEIEKYLKMVKCSACDGKRLKKEMLSITVLGKSIDALSEMSIDKLYEYFSILSRQEKNNSKGEFDKNEWKVARQIIKEIEIRLKNLCNAGVDYLTLARSVNTLAGGEYQRIKLAAQISSLLTGLIYVLDEPSIGLHPKDNTRLINTLKDLRDQGNSVIVVEHDKDTIMSGDYVIDVGKGAGIYGGEIIAKGTPKEIIENKESLTGKYLKGDLKIPIPEKLRKGNSRHIEIKGASEFNLKNIDVKIPLGKLVCVTGVSGSGKSTLITDILAKFLLNKFYRAKEEPGKFKSIEGAENLNKIINIDQSPIGRTPRSNPATYTGLFTYIRDLFANLPESKMRGYRVGNFSFNVREGRCEACAGEGMVKIQMPLLQDIYIECEECGGRRYCTESLEIHWHNKNIADILNMTVQEAKDFFKFNTPPIDSKKDFKKLTNENNIIYNKLKTLTDVGLGYIKLGQSATTLSGGEAQRIKLASELSKKSTGKTLYILDEPTTGLHFDDINRLLFLLNKLVDQGNTVLIIEHNLDVIKCADWIIDLGPVGGDKGGYLVAEGTLQDIIKTKESFTGKYLKAV